MVKCIPATTTDLFLLYFKTLYKEYMVMVKIRSTDHQIPLSPAVLTF